MIHTVLARKWRPKKFADIVGQNNSIKILINTITTQRLHHAILLTGTRGVGKTTIARIIAKALNCTNLNNGEPCTTCINCTQIDNGKFIDVIEIDAASNTGVDNVREIIDNSRYAPIGGKYKVYIIDEVHMLSKSAFNAMLKTLEEPPPHAIFILATTELAKVPATILSRCLQLKLRHLLVTEIHEYLIHILKIENQNFESDAIELIAVAAGGSMRDALSILDQAIAFSNNTILSKSKINEMLGLCDSTLIFELLTHIINADTNSVMTLTTTLYNDGANLENVLLNLQQELSNISIAQLTTTAATTSPQLLWFINHISVNDVHLYFEIINLGLEQLHKSTNSYSIFIMTMLRLCAFKIGTSIESKLIVTASNFNIKNETTPKDHTPIQQQHTALKDATPIQQQQTAPKDATPMQQQFNGDWLELIATLKPSLGALFPFVENSQLNTYTNNTFNIIIDQRYKSAIKNNTQNEICNILNNYFMKNITLTINFADKINNSLKEKTLQEQEHKQALAVTSINQDPYLITLQQQTSAIIISESIKPI